MAETNADFTRPDPTLIRRAASFPSATLHEAMGRKGAFPHDIKPIAPKMILCGPALTVICPPMDNLGIHRAIYLAQPGDVLVVSVGGGYEGGYWGEIMTFAAQQRGIAGLVIDGCVRDRDLIEEMGFPVFSRGLAIHGTIKKDKGVINSPLKIGAVLINPGDLLVGDSDGVVLVPQSEISQAIEASQQREDKEDQYKMELAAGKSTLEIIGIKI